MSRYHWLVVMAFTCLTAMILGGCATNMTEVRESLYHEDGTPSSQFAFVNKNVVTWGSTQEEGAGQMSYQGDGWQLDANGGAKNQQAGEVTATQLVGILQLLQKLYPDTPPPIPAP